MKKKRVILKKISGNYYESLLVYLIVKTKIFIRGNVVLGLIRIKKDDKIKRVAKMYLWKAHAPKDSRYEFVFKKEALK